MSRNLADLSGAKIKGSIPLGEKILNDIANQQIAERPGRIKHFDIQVGAENYLQLGIQVAVGPFTKWFRPEVIVTTETPVILFTLASREYAGLMWLAELFAKEVLPSGVRINGNQVTLDLREAPQLAPYRKLLSYLKALRVSSRTGTLVIEFDYRID
jgi:hypothetical protein